MLPIYLLTNNNHLWLLPGFAYLWHKYGDSSQRVIIIGFDAPKFKLPPNFRFHSLGRQLPAGQWSNGLLKAVNELGYKYFILMLEDFWLYDYVDRLVLNELRPLLNDGILRIDLSGNRAGYKSARQVGEVLDYTLVETPNGTPYQMSFQAAIWHRDNLASVLRPDENPWQAEVDGSLRVGVLRVLGTKPAVIRYQPVWRSQQRRWQLDKIKTEDWEHIRKQGWLNED